MNNYTPVRPSADEPFVLFWVDESTDMKDMSAALAVSVRLSNELALRDLLRNISFYFKRASTRLLSFSS